MKKILFLATLYSSTLLAQYGNGEELLKAMHDKYAGKYCQTIMFDQRTVKYDTSGAIKDTALWYEWISYPDKFRIDFGKKFVGPTKRYCQSFSPRRFYCITAIGQS